MNTIKNFILAYFLIVTSLTSCNIFDGPEIVTDYFILYKNQPHPYVRLITVEKHPEIFVGDSLKITCILQDSLNHNDFSFFWRAPNEVKIPFVKTTEPYFETRGPNKSGYFWVSLYVENDSTQSKSEEFVFGIPVRQD